MRIFLPLLAVTAALSLAVGCGGGDSATSDTISPQRTEELLGPEMAPAKAPPPKNLVIKDVKVGSGPVARKGDTVQLHWISYFYKSGEVLERVWLTQKPVEYVVGTPHYREAFEKGIEGMRAGGEREIIEPGRFVSTGQPEIHLIQLDSLEPTDNSG